MAKLTTMQKETFNNCRDYLAECNVRVFFSRELRMMIGIVSDNYESRSKDPIIYRMFVTLCNPADEFKKKLGVIELCNKFENDQYNLVKLDYIDPEGFVFSYMTMFANGMSNTFDFQEMEIN